METIGELNQLTSPLQQKLNDALSSLIRKPVTLSLKNGGIVSITSVHEWMETPQESYTAIYIPIMGDVIGDIFVFMPQRAAYLIADLMIGNPLGTTTTLGEFESSALKELGNITTGVIVTELANTLNMSMMLTVPNLASDMVGALVDQVLIEYGETSDDLLVIQFPFSIELDNQTVNGSFDLFFDKNSTDQIVSRLQQKNSNQGNHE